MDFYRIAVAWQLSPIGRYPVQHLYSLPEKQNFFRLLLPYIFSHREPMCSHLSSVACSSFEKIVYGGNERKIPLLLRHKVYQISNYFVNSLDKRALYVRNDVLTGDKFAGCYWKFLSGAIKPNLLTHID